MKIRTTKQLSKLREVACKCEQVASCYFSTKDKEWNMLLKFRDRLRKHIDKFSNNA